MSEPKWTDGPWRVIPSEHAQSRWIVGDAKGGSIADCAPMGLAGADPPWIDDAVSLFHAVYGGIVDIDAALRSALRFAACQPRPITDAMVEAAASVIRRETAYGKEDPALMIARYALEAAEKARANEWPPFGG